MLSRFLDSKEQRFGSDFVLRNYGVPLLCLFVVFLAVWAFILLVVYSANALTVHSAALVSFSFLLLLFVCFFYLRRLFLALHTVEFQNSIYSGAIRIVNPCYIIAKDDGSIVYMDQELNRRFINLRKEGVAGLDLLRKAGISNKHFKGLLKALKEGRKEIVPFDHRNENAFRDFLQVKVEPIAFDMKEEFSGNLRLAATPLQRPSGYFLLRVEPQEVSVSSASDMFSEVSVGHYIIDGEGKFIHVNDMFIALLDFAREDVFVDDFSLENVVYQKRFYKQLLHAEKPWQGELALCAKNDQQLDVFLYQIPYVDAKGNYNGNQGIVIPLSKKNKRISTIPKGLMQQRVMASSPIATAVFDDRAEVLEGNKAFCDIIHVASKQLAGVSLWSILAEEDREVVESVFYQVVEGDLQSAKPLDVSLAYDTDCKASLYLNRIQSKDGAFSGVVAHLIDTTEAKNLELRFVHSQKMQAVGQLAGGIAHDFNNLLTAMMGFCDLLLMRHPAGDQSFADIMQIKQNASRAANLVRQLLAFSRKQTLQPEVINITDNLADLSNLIGRLIGENIELNMVHGRDLYMVKVDQGQLEQVVINLAVNARDAMPNGGELTICSNNVTIGENHILDQDLVSPAEEEEVEEGDYVLIEVLDTGSGIAKENLSQIFEPFFSTKEIGAGTGLGLSTVYGIIKQTDGYIYVSSKEGKGTKFSLFFRAVKPEEAKKKLKSDGVGEKEKHSDLTGKGTILLVEDETPVRIFSSSALEKKGYTMLEADCGEAALDIVKEQGDQIELIITDVVMPGINGPTFIKEVLETYPDIKVIFISGYAEDAFIKSYGEDREFNFLPKPYTLNQLAQKVKDVFEG